MKITGWVAAMGATWSAIAWAEPWEKKHYVFFEPMETLEAFAAGPRGKAVTASAKKATTLSFTQGPGRIIPPDTQLVLLAENHEDGAGSIGYPRLLEAIYGVFPFDCVFFERDPRLSADRLDAIAADLRARVAAKHAASFADAAEKLVAARPTALFANLGYPVYVAWTSTDIAETRILGFILAHDTIRWDAIDDVSRVQPWIFWDIGRRNEVMAEKIATAFRSPASRLCRRALGINGKKHLTGYIEASGRDAEPAKPLQWWVQQKSKLRTRSILLSSGYEFVYSKLAYPTDLYGRWLPAPAFDLAIESENVDGSLLSSYAGLFESTGEWTIASSQEPKAVRRSFSPDPDHTRPRPGYGETETIYHLMQGNVRSFDAVLYVR